MRKALCMLFVMLSVSACSDGSPEARQNLAKCELSPRASDSYGGYNVKYLITCMQAAGFVEDNNLTESGGTRCYDDGNPWVTSDCYRADNDIAAWLAKEGAKPKSN